jgi:hypothetical protein
MGLKNEPTVNNTVIYPLSFGFIPVLLNLYYELGGSIDIITLHDGSVNSVCS